ncbi:fused MFS/spermidine synthase [Haladaptatus sp. DJG-WS-42]|uniref:spermidine synthase n=1 Tax=Haladaptatus sp. DJG-WS-42 TaxID=3120516 RepID=UPI0030CE97BC
MVALRTRLPPPPAKPELAVFASGMTSMGLEILAGRMIAPQFGSSIFTWGSIIGVFLTALSLGYLRGGASAASRASNRRLVRLLLGTALYVAVVIFAGDTLLRASTAFPLPSRFASLPAILLLFAPPTYLLGFISPYAAELSDKQSTGAASGRVYAIGTVGSIIGAFGTTFILIPSLSIDQIGLVLGLIAVLAAILIARPMTTDQAFGSTAVALVLVAAAGSGLAGLSIEGRIVYETQTPYQELQVIDLGDTRTLYLDGQRHSAMDLSDPRRHVFGYTRYFHLPLLMNDDVDNVLFIGGGGFTGPKRFVADYNVTVDVVEIDPEVIAVAKEYFAVEESERLRIHNMDGRQYLRETNETYDLIILDAYQKDKVPFQLTTEEFMRLAESRLSDDGILFANIISAPSGSASQFYRAEYKTMSAVFPQVYSFPTVDATVIQNIEVIATKNATVLTREELLLRNSERDIGINLRNEIQTYRASENTAGVPLLRDDQAPIDSLLDPQVGQRYVIQEGNRTNTTATATG